MSIFFVGNNSLRSAVPCACPRGWVQWLLADVGVDGLRGQGQATAPTVRVTLRLMYGGGDLHRGEFVKTYEKCNSSASSGAQAEVLVAFLSSVPLFSCQERSNSGYLIYVEHMDRRHEQFASFVRNYNCERTQACRSAR